MIIDVIGQNTANSIQSSLVMHKSLIKCKAITIRP